MRSNEFILAEHNEIGIQGEKMALNHLIKKGYIILEKNYRFKQLEVDIIAKLGDLLVVVEVKTRQSKYMAGPEITVTRSKQRSIIKVTNDFIQKREWNGETQFDIVSIIIQGKKIEIDHLEDAFYPH